MKIYHHIAELAVLPGPVSLAIGVFDGVHLGHQAVIAEAIHASGESAAVVTFDPHPAQLLRPEQSPALLTSTRHKLSLLAQLGVANTLIIPFDSAFAKTLPADFITDFTHACKLRQICVGQDWAFGHGRKGNLALLQLLGSAMRFKAVGLPAVAIEGQIVSSTAIRAAIQAGDLATAARLLGRPFSIYGTVNEGRKMGRQLGFPTANLTPEREQLPPDGVYAVRAQIPKISAEWLPCVANIGVRPTVCDTASERVLEVHLFDFDADIYHHDIEVEFHHFLRPEVRFPDIETLRTQITADTAQARALHLKSPFARRSQIVDCETTNRAVMT